MSSLLDKAMGDENQDNPSDKNPGTDQTGAAPPAGQGGSLLEQAMASVGDTTGNPPAAHQQFHDAASQLSQDEFHAAATDALGSMPPETLGKLGQALASQGAAQGAGVPADTKEPGELAKMVHWVHKHVPGGVPGALGIVGAVGAAGATAYEAQKNPGAVSGMVQKAQSALGESASVGGVLDGGTAHTVFNAVQTAVAGQIASRSTK